VKASVVATGDAETAAEGDADAGAEALEQQVAEGDATFVVGAAEGDGGGEKLNESEPDADALTRVDGVDDRV